MKKQHLFFLAIAVLLPTLHLWSQNDSTQRASKRRSVFEAGTTLYSLTLRPGNFYTRYHPVVDNQVLSGLYLKYHRGLNALRWELNYSQRNLRYDNGYGGRLARSQETTRSVELKMGYQRSFGSRRFSLYGFADLEYNHFWTSNYNFFYGYYDKLTVPYYERSYLLTGSFFGVTPGVGLRWKLGKHLVLNVESAAQFFYAKEPPDYFTSNKPVKSVGINLRPLKFSLGFIF